MVERFQGSQNAGKLLEAIKLQEIVQNDEALAALLLKDIELLEFEPETRIIAQGGSDNELYFIFAGKVFIEVNGRRVAVRKAKQHIGEMALINPETPRTASVIASEQTVVGKISEPAFTIIAEQFPRLWQQIALYLSERLQQRNELVSQRNSQPALFVGSSVESLAVAREIQDAFRHDAISVRLWPDKVFGASNFAIDDLQNQVQVSDFAVLVLGPDDKVISRNTESDAPRDNVIFELGFFMGALTRNRTFLVLPRGSDIKIPSDLLGLTPLEYAIGSSESLPSRIAPVCNDLRAIINKKGPKGMRRGNYGIS